MTQASLDLLGSAPAVVGALERSGLLAGVRAAQQALSVAFAEERAAQESAALAEASLNEVSERLALAGRAFRSQGQEMSAVWSELVAPAAARLRAAQTPLDRLAAIAAIAERLGFERQIPWLDDDAFAAFVDDPHSSVVFAGVDQAEIRPTHARLEELGPRVTPPIADQAAQSLLGATMHPELLDVDPYAGMHVSIERRGGLYRHHGVLLGGGRVAHFCGEPLAMSEATIRVDSVEAFIGSSDSSTLRRHIPERVGRAPVAVYLPNLAALRAASMAGADGYDLFQRNCEHFAAWCQMGAMISGQVDELWTARQVASARHVAGVARKVPGVSHVDPKALTATFIAAWTMRVAELPLAPPPNGAPGSDRKLYDLGRIRWSRDQNDFVWWLPLWHHDDPRSDEKRPDGPTDRPFAVGADPSDATWHTGRPSAGLSADWHAAVLGASDGEIFLLDRDGVWRQPIADVAEIVISRSAAMEALHRTLVKREDIFEPPPDRPDGPSELTP